MKYTKAIVAFMVVLAVFLVCLDAVIVSHERRTHYAEFNEQAQNEFTLIETFVTEPLLQENFTLVEQFMMQWGEKNSDIVELRAFSSHGLLLAEFKRPTPENDTVLFRHSVHFQGKHLLDLEITKDLSPIVSHIRQFWQQLIFQSLFVTVALGIVLWVILKVMALRPLEAEIARRKQAEEDLQKAKDQLEVQVAERTLNLQEQKEQLQAITDNIPGVVYQFYSRSDGEAGIRYTSPKLRDIFKMEFIDDPPVVLQTFIGNIHGEDRQSFIDSVHDVVEKQIPWNWSGRYVKPSGEIIWFEGHSSPVVRKNEILFNGILFDITSVKKLEEEKKKAETQLHRGQKMEAIGMMAGGVAHDLNNILSGIISYPELLLLDLPADSPLRKPIETIQNSGHRAAAVVADLLTVARGAAAATEVCDLNKLLLEYLKSPELKCPLEAQADITVHTDLAPDLFTLNCSAIHIRKCLLNLFVNACEAIDKIGTVTISTRNLYIDKPLKGYDEVRRGEYVVLSVADTGSGISAEDLEHIFEPFYSKKVMGRSGTGLGLAVVWSALQDHNAYIDVTSDNQGTRFDLYFPASRELADEGKGKTTSRNVQGKGQRILVIDDEATQRDIATSLLTRLGYQPSSVSSGEEAVDFLKAHKVDLLVLDMIMDPGMNGRKTYEQIIALHPGQKAIIASGFSETDEVKKAQDLGAGIFIKKPYTINQLGSAVKQELAA
jgi:signal transduction histidine kinase/ActR/RegA family two-component response regulator